MNYSELMNYTRSENERIWLQAIIECGSVNGASIALGIPQSTLHDRYSRLKANAKNMGWNPSESQIQSTPSYSAKILIIDIETSPTLAYVWKMWKENIGNSQVVENSYIMCFSAKWLGKPEIIYAETRTDNDFNITKQMIELLDEADIVVAHNAKRFDIPRINASAIHHGITPPKPYKVVDTLDIARKNFKFERNTLEHIAEYLHCTPKDKHKQFAGFELWKECLKGNDEAWSEMMHYNIQDVHTLEEVYLKLRSWDKQHPNVSVHQEDSEQRCSKCGSANVVLNGHTVTDVSKFELWKCNDCGGFSRGRSSKYPKEIRKELLTPVR